MTPKLGPYRLLRLTLTRADEGRLLAIASEVAFFALLSLVPALSILVLVYGLVLDRTGLWAHVAPLVSLLPEMAQEVIRDQTSRLVNTPKGDLSFNLLVSAMIAAWSANAATKALFDAVNLLHGQKEVRNFVALNALSLATTLGGVLFFVVAIALLGLLPLLHGLLPYITGLKWAASWLRYPLIFVSSVVLIALLYRVALIGTQRARDLLPGALLAGLLWAGLTSGFGWYATRLGNYAATYGSLAAVIVFLTWLWLSVAAILMGAAFNAARGSAR